MKKRSWDILQALINFGDGVVDDIVKAYAITERTLRNDVSDINTFLNKLNQPKIITDKEGMLTFEGEMDRQVILDYLKKIDYYAYKHSPEERQNIIALILLKEKNYITMNQIAEELFVSRITIMNDLAVLEKRLTKYGIGLVSKASKGVSIIYDEFQARQFIMTILEEYFPKPEAETVIQKIILNETYQSISLEKLYNDLHIIEQKLEIVLSDRAFKWLLFYLYCSLNRSVLGYQLEYKIDKSGFKNERSLAEEIMAELSWCQNEEISSGEIAGLSHVLHLYRLLPRSLDISDYPDLYSMVADLLYKVSSDIHVKLFEDYSLFEFLILHIQSLIDRSRAGEQLKNPFFDEINEKYPNVMAAVRKNIITIQAICHCQFTDQELSFLAMHICAAIERVKPPINTFDVMIVCPGSMATGQLLAAQVRKHFNFNIKGVIKVDHVLTSMDLEVDFILSTVPIAQSRWPVIVVRPVLQSDDINRILTFTFRLYKTKKIKDHTDQPDVIKEINFLLTDSDTKKSQKFQTDLWKLVNDYKFSITEKKEKITLSSVLNPSTIEYVDEEMSWRQALISANKKLVEFGYANESYGDALVQITEKYGPYFVFRKGIALAHAGNKDGVISLGMSLLIFKQGVHFGNKENDPVQLLFCLSNDSSRNYLQMVNNLIELGKDPGTIKLLLESNDTYDVYNIIKNKEAQMPKFDKSIRGED